MKIITIEEHVNLHRLNIELSKYYNEDSENAKNAGGKGLPYYPNFDIYDESGIEMRIADMDKYGIDKQILSCPSQTQILDLEDASRVVREANDDLYNIVSKYPDRLGAFGILPWSDINGCVDEIKRLKNELGFNGVLLSGRPSMEAIFLDDERYYPILKTLEELQMPLYLHPAPPLKSVQENYYRGLGDKVSSRLSLYGWGWHNEVGVQIIRMILGGVFEKFPNLKIISGHWGEMVPFFLSRLDQAIPQSLTKNSRSITETFKNNVYVTPSGIFDYPQLKFCLETLGADRIIYSVDFPFIENDKAKEFILNAPISDTDKELIAYQNAYNLLYK